MLRRVSVTLKFFANLARDIAGTFRGRWRRFHRRVVLGEDIGAVAVDVFPFFERMTGVGWYEWNLLEALDRRDDGLSYNLYARTFLAPDDPEPPPMPGNRHMRYRVHQIPSGFLLPVQPMLSGLRVFLEPVLRVLDGNDVLFAPNFFLQRSQEPFGRSQVATVHDLAFAVMPETVAPETLEGLRQRLPNTLCRAERLIAVSDATADEIAEYLDVNRRFIHTIHEGVAEDFGSSSSAEAPPSLPERYLLFVSTLEPRKNVVGVLRAFALLKDWGYEGDLVLVGRWGWRTQAIRDELEQSSARQWIHHLDYVDRSQLAALYSGADSLVFPSWIEGFGLPLLEAMACGTPVITSGTSAMPEVAGPAAVYVDPASPHSIASAVSALLEDPGHRARLVELGRNRVAKFSWDRAAAATAQVLRQAAGLPATGPDEYRA